MYCYSDEDGFTRQDTMIRKATVFMWLIMGWPVLRWLWQQWQGNDFYSHGLLVFPLAAYLFWKLRPPQEVWRESSWGLLALGVSTLLYVVALHSHATYLAAFFWIGMGASLVWAWGGIQVLRRLSFPILFALLAVPLPFVEAASLPLSQWAGSWAGHIVRLFGIPVEVRGNMVSLPGTDLVVGAQCSGLRSMVALVTLSVLFAFLVQGPWWGRFILVLSALPIALVGNLARVTTLLMVAHRWGTEAGFRFYHNYSGYVFLLAAFATLILISWGVRCREIRSDIF